MDNEIAREIVEALGYAWETDQERLALYNRVEEWLLDNPEVDDGSSFDELAIKFDEMVGV